jgi:hypothetical protein
VPHTTVRDKPSEDGRLPLAHVSDQLRKLVPDGREDLSQAAAFEIGRLLALSQPSVISALMRWRRQRFTVARVARLAELIRPGIAELLPNVEWLKQPDLGDLVSKELVRAAGTDPERVLAPSRPLADPARPLDLRGNSLDTVLARGLGIPAAAIQALRGEQSAGVEQLGLGALSELKNSDVTLGHAADAEFDGESLEQLARGLTDVVEHFANNALAASGAVPSAGFDPGRNFRGGGRP